MNHPTHPVEQEEVMAYLDGELSAARAAELAAHLNGCAECRALASDLRGVSQQMLAWQVEPVPAAIAAAVSEAAKKPHKRTPAEAKPRWHVFAQRPLWQRGAIVLGTVAVASLMILWFQRPLHEKMRVSEALPVAQRTAGEIRAGRADRNGSAAKDRFDRIELESKIFPPPATSAGPSTTDGRFHPGAYKGWLEQGPMVARTASLSLVVKDFAASRASVEQIVRQLNGYIGELSTESPQGSAQTLSATLRIPAPQLDAALMQLKSRGRVEQETQGGEEVSEQHADLVARLKNARATEQRLLDVLRQRTGKVADILQVEEEIANTRQLIEQMEAEQKGLEKRVAYGSVQLKVTEEYKAQLNFAPPSTVISLRNAATAGYRNLVDSLLGLILWLASYFPVLMFWALLLLWPVRLVWRRIRPARQQAPAA